jgi:hypothetical protein
MTFKVKKLFFINFFAYFYIPTLNKTKIIEIP